MKSKNKYILFLALVLSLSYAQKGLTHGTHIEYNATEAIKIKATYDSGEPMNNGQVTVYNPNEPTKPWLTGVTNKQGEFVFVPDYSVRGNWQIKVRQAGHGNIINIPIEAVGKNKLKNNEESITNSGEIKNSDPIKLSNSQNNQYTIQQKLIMALSGIWGFVGTALYFSKKKAEQ